MEIKMIQKRKMKNLVKGMQEDGKENEKNENENGSSVVVSQNDDVEDMNEEGIDEN